MNKKGLLAAKILSIIFVPGVLTVYVTTTLVKLTQRLHFSNKLKKVE